MARLTGEALLEHIKRNGGNKSRDELIADAGYVVTRNNKPSLQRTDFMQAFADAQGLSLGPATNPHRRGKEPGYQLKVGPKGMVPVGVSYTSMIGAEPGETLQVEIDGDCIVLSRL